MLRAERRLLLPNRRHRLHEHGVFSYVGVCWGHDLDLHVVAVGRFDLGAPFRLDKLLHKWNANQSPAT